MANCLYKNKYMQDKEIKNMSDIIVGLDIGTTKIAIMVGRKNKYEIRNFSNC